MPLDVAPLHPSGLLVWLERTAGDLRGRKRACPVTFLPVWQTHDWQWQLTAIPPVM